MKINASPYAALSEQSLAPRRMLRFQGVDGEGGQRGAGDKQCRSFTMAGEHALNRH